MDSVETWSFMFNNNEAVNDDYLDMVDDISYVKAWFELNIWRSEVSSCKRIYTFLKLWEECDVVHWYDLNLRGRTNQKEGEREVGKLKKREKKVQCCVGGIMCSLSSVRWHASLGENHNPVMLDKNDCQTMMCFELCPWYMMDERVQIS